jgi:hypothetical protein
MKLVERHDITITGYERRQLIDEGNSFRFLLKHCWSDAPIDLYIGANPSKAGHLVEDPTVRFFKKSSSHRGMGGFYVWNPIPYRSSKPPEALEWLGQFSSLIQPVLDENFKILRDLAPLAQNIILCWGAILPEHCGALKSSVYDILHKAGRSKWQCFGLTNAGHPKHPAAYGKALVSPFSPLQPWSPHGPASKA